jgi:murein DD-endopeptidase MepM/ murein hydrolase activator NlpD
MISGLFFISLLSFSYSQEPDPRQDLIEAGREERSIVSQIEEIDIALGTLREEKEQIKEETQTFETQKLEQAKKVALATLELESKKTDLNKTLRALYKLHKRGLARVVFGAESPIELRRRSSYLLSLVQLSTKKLDAYKLALSKREQEQKLLATTNQQLRSSQEKLLLKEQELEEKRLSKQYILTDVRQKRTRALQLLSEINRSRKNLQEQIPIPTKSSSTPFSSLYGKLPWPVQGTLIRRFGKQKNDVNQLVDNHGIDIEAPFGSPVRTVAAGKVILAEFIPAYGMTIAIQHDTYSTIYAHLNGLNVRKGQVVSPRTIIGYVGNTGLTDTTNRYILGFEIRKNRLPQDPLPWLTRR